MAHDSLLNKEFEDGLIQNPLPVPCIHETNVFCPLSGTRGVGLCAGAFGPLNRPFCPRWRAVGCFPWPWIPRSRSPFLRILLAATEMPLPPNDGSLVLTLSPKGLFSRGSRCGGSGNQGVLHLWWTREELLRGKSEAIWEPWPRRPAFVD